MIVVVVIALGCLILSTIDGFVGVALWALLAPIICIVLDLLLRARPTAPVAKQAPVDETRPAKLSAGLKPGMTYARIRHRRSGSPGAEPPFTWQSEAHQKRSEQEGRAARRVRNAERRRER